MTPLIFYVQFKLSKVPVTGLNVSVDVDRIERSSGNTSSLFSGESATEIRNGVYQYQIADADLSLYDYLPVFYVADDSLVEDNYIPTLWTSYSVAYDEELQNLDSPISSIEDAIAGINPGTGTGSITVPYTVTDGTNPIVGASIYVTTDEAGLNVVANATTNSQGVATVYLDAGSYYFWTQKAGYAFPNPEIEEIS